jgi:hypothetical protein
VVLACGAAVVAWFAPRIGIQSGFIFQKLLWILGVLTALWIAIPLAQDFLPAFARPLTRAGRLVTRRQAIIAASVLLLTVAAGLHLKPRRQPRFRQRRWRDRQTQRWIGTTGAGFYTKVGSAKSGDKPASENEIKQAPSEPSIVLHYSEKSGKTWRRGQVPQGPLEKVKIWDVAENDRSLEFHALLYNIVALTTFDESDLLRQIESREIQLHGPHVNLASASWAFEEAVMEVLGKEPFHRKHSAKVCELLVFAIKHDIVFRRAVTRRPNYRLYDLLAGVCVRFKHDRYLTELKRLILDAGEEGPFKTRMTRWNDPQGSWRKRWRNRGRPLKWTSSSAGVVF